LERDFADALSARLREQQEVTPELLRSFDHGRRSDQDNVIVYATPADA
jgi:hypothetical protein